MDTSAPRISIQEALASIRSATSTTRPFRLEIVVSTGRSKGDIRVLAQCIKGAPAGAPATPTIGAAGRAEILHKERDTIPITDLEDGHYKTILISHIIGFNEFKVYH